MPQMLVQVKRIQQQDSGVITLRLQDLGRGFATLGVIGAGKVEPALIGPHLGKEFPPIPEALQIEQFRLNQAVAGFHVGVGIGRGRWQKAVLAHIALDLVVKAPVALLAVVAAVFAAVVGGQYCAGQFQSMRLQMA